MRLIDAENTNLIDAIGRNAFKDRQDIIDLINKTTNCRYCTRSTV